MTREEVKRLMNVQSVNSIEERVVKTLCPICATRCGINIHLRGNTIVKVEPMAEHKLRSGLCLKNTALADYQQSKDRLLYPLKRVNGDFIRVSWDEAMDTIVTRLNEIKGRYGPEALTVGLGHGMFVDQTLGLIRRFAEAYGTPNILTAGAICEWPRTAACQITLGFDVHYDIARAECVLFWGLNYHNSVMAGTKVYNQLKEKGVKTIVIDPRVSFEAKRAELYLQVRPGVDLALLLAFINVIVSEDLCDKDFVDKWTVGFDKLAEAVKEYTPEKAEEITGVPADRIIEAARMYATNKPACIGADVSMQHNSNGFQNFRALLCLAGITGNIGVYGGQRVIYDPPPFVAFPYQDKDYTPKGKTFTADKYPLYEKTIKECHASCLADTILSEKPYPIKAAIIEGFNPAVTFPNTNKVKKALRELELFVVLDIFPTETTELADIILPAASRLEKRWAHSYVWAQLPLLAMSNKVFEPSGESRDDAEFWLELGRRMGYEDSFPWKSTDEVLEAVIKPYGKTLKDMAEHPEGFFYKPKSGSIYDEPAFRFNTPSGKIELYSETLEKMGLPPLPVPYIEPVESPVRTPELFKEYPLMALSGIRTQEYEHSCDRNLPRLRSRRPDPEVDIHPVDAKNSGVEHGEWVIIESPKGKAKMKANVTEDIMPGVVSMPHGWGGEANCNLLTSDEVLDPIVGTCLFKGFACRVKKAG